MEGLSGREAFVQLARYTNDIPVTETQTDTEMIDTSKTHTETNTEKIFNADTIYTVNHKKVAEHL